MNCNNLEVAKEDVLAKEVQVITVEGSQFLVPNCAKVVFQCHRGFWWFKDRKPEAITTGRRIEWTEHKKLLQCRGPYPKPVRSEPRDNWLTHMYRPETKIPSKMMPVIDCRLDD